MAIFRAMAIITVLLLAEHIFAQGCEICLCKNKYSSGYRKARVQAQTCQASCQQTAKKYHYSLSGEVKCQGQSQWQNQGQNQRQRLAVNAALPVGFSQDKDGDRIYRDLEHRAMYNSVESTFTNHGFADYVGAE